MIEAQIPEMKKDYKLRSFNTKVYEDDFHILKHCHLPKNNEIMVHNHYVLKL